MGRAVRSYPYTKSAAFGEPGKTPEERLFAAVLSQAVHDAPFPIDRMIAAMFIFIILYLAIDIAF